MKLEFGDPRIDLCLHVAGVRVEQFRRLSEQDQSALLFTFLEAHESAEPIAVREACVEVERFLQRGLGLFVLVVQEEDLGLVPQHLRGVRKLLDELGDRLLRGGVLTLFVLGERLFDKRVVGLAAPLELFAATAGAARVRVDRHEGAQPGPWRRAEKTGPSINSIKIASSVRWENPPPAL